MLCCSYFFAEMAKKLYFIVLDHGCETCLDRLMVCHALRISALSQSYNFLRHFELLLFNYLEVPYDIHRSIRRNECQLVELVILEELISNLDDAFLSMDLADKIDSYCDLAFYSLEVQDIQCLIYIFSGYMVQYGTILQCAYYQFFSAHDYLYPSKYEIMAMRT